MPTFACTTGLLVVLKVTYPSFAAVCGVTVLAVLLCAVGGRAPCRVGLFAASGVFAEAPVVAAGLRVAGTACVPLVLNGVLNTMSKYTV